MKFDFCKILWIISGPGRWTGSFDNWNHFQIFKEKEGYRLLCPRSLYDPEWINADSLDDAMQKAEDLVKEIRVTWSAPLESKRIGDRQAVYKKKSY